MNYTDTKFQEGNVYEMRYIGHSQLLPKWICMKRTEKTATFERFMKGGDESITRRIKISDGVEYIVNGSYSMAPSIRANRVVE